MEETNPKTPSLSSANNTNNSSNNPINLDSSSTSAGLLGVSNGSNHGETKPDISQLSLNSNTFMMAPRYLGYPPAPNQPVMFDACGGGTFNNLQSPSLHSQSSLSPTSLVSSPPPNFINMQSPSSTINSSPSIITSNNTNSSVGDLGNHFSNSKHLCAICGDRASGKHYGVYSCEGCKGFFKRTVRKDLQYACRDEKNCLIDKRQRNRCQYCRYMKCLATGMKREAVQEERQRARERNQAEAESTTCVGNDMPVEAILEAEVALEQQVDSPSEDLLSSDFSSAAERLIYSLMEWAKKMPHFVELNPDDQVVLLKTAWNELLISTIAQQSVNSSREGLLCLTQGIRLSRETASQVGMANIFDRVINEMVAKIRDMGIDRTELGCMRAIVLFNPDAKGLVAPQPIECLREKVYASLEDYCRQQNPEEPGRFAKLLLRLPALRSIGLKCLDHLFFFKMAEETNIESFLSDALDNPNS